MCVPEVQAFQRLKKTNKPNAISATSELLQVNSRYYLVLNVSRAQNSVNTVYYLFFQIALFFPNCLFWSLKFFNIVKPASKLQSLYLQNPKYTTFYYLHLLSNIKLLLNGTENQHKVINNVTPLSPLELHHHDYQGRLPQEHITTNCFRSKTHRVTLHALVII